jgi:high-affinity nickel-transport protein
MAQRGLLGRLVRGLFRLITRSWHTYPLDFLSGLDFDTATELGLLAASLRQRAACGRRSACSPIISAQ